MSKIKYFTDGNNAKFVVEKATETGFVVHKVESVGSPVGKSFEISYDDVLADYKIDNIKLFPEKSVEDLDGLFALIKTLKRDARTERLEAEEAKRKADAEQAELDRIAAEAKAVRDLEERRRKAKALKLKAELDEEN